MATGDNRLMTSANQDISHVRTGSNEANRITSFIADPEDDRNKMATQKITHKWRNKKKITKSIETFNAVKSNKRD